AQEMQDKYRSLFDSIDAGFCVIDVIFDAQGKGVDYVFREVNRAFEHHTGIRDAIGRTMCSIASGHEPSWYEIYGEIATSGTPRRFEQAAEQLGFYYDVYAFPIGTSAPYPLGVLFSDISHRKLEQRALEEDSRRKTEFIAMLAHELRNPLATVTSGLQVMSMADCVSGPGKTVAPMIERQLRQTTQLLDDLLDINRITLGKVLLRKTGVALDALAREVLEAYSPQFVQAGKLLVCNIAPDDHGVWADPIRINQVLGNLIGNALKFTDTGGRIEIELTREQDESVLRVRDDGVGIEASQLDNIFELFAQVDPAHQASHEGLGVGMTLAKELVELHDGSLHAYSEGLGRGAVFEMRLPSLQAQSQGDEGMNARQALGMGPYKILVVDDNRDAADSISMVMELLGHEVTTCYSGQEGLDTAAALSPHVVFTDIGMPGMDGHEVCRRLRDQPGGDGLRIVALTGWGADGDRQKTQEAGFDHHLVKPVTAESLKQALVQVAT
ncbi:MAG: ATP-binding protein, partial [Pseudoxanthomonas sp.]